MGTVRFTRTSPGGRGQHQVVQFKRKTGAEALVFDLPGSIVRRISGTPGDSLQRGPAVGTHNELQGGASPRCGTKISSLRLLPGQLFLDNITN